MKKNFYKDILETIREPLCVVDSSEMILYRNPAFDQHFQIDESADFPTFSIVFIIEKHNPHAQ